METREDEDREIGVGFWVPCLPSENVQMRAPFPTLDLKVSLFDHCYIIQGWRMMRRVGMASYETIWSYICAPRMIYDVRVD
jgi:hypothetical protein